MTIHTLHEHIGSRYIPLSVHALRVITSPTWMGSEVLTYIYIYISTYFIMTSHTLHEHIGTRYISLRGSVICPLL